MYFGENSSDMFDDDYISRITQLLSNIDDTMDRLKSLFMANSDDKSYILKINHSYNLIAQKNERIKDLIFAVPEDLKNISHRRLTTIYDVIDDAYKKYFNNHIAEEECINNISSLYSIYDNLIKQLERYVTRSTDEDEAQEYIIDDPISNFDKFSAELSALKNKSIEDAKQIDNLKQTFQREINTLNTKYKEDLSKFESISQALTFQKASESYQLTANSWRKIVIAICLILLGLLLAFGYYTWIDFEHIQKYLDDGGINASTSRINTLFYYEIVSKSVLRIMVLSLAVFFIKFSVKNYNAAKHNMITNLHKANSLATASRLIATSPDTETFNAIITLAAKEIFTQPRTGFLVKDDSKVDIGLINDTISTFTKKG